MRKPFSETRACERIVKETLTSGWENPSLETFNSTAMTFSTTTAVASPSGSFEI